MITANQVKELREKTGAGMMDCKKVLAETNGDEEKAIELLNSSEANITQISELVGFNSSSYFSETFKKFYNITPLEYKYQNSNKKD